MRNVADPKVVQTKRTKFKDVFPKIVPFMR